jgi:hypothetical protein
MAKRVILAGIVGGVALFFWLSIAHIFTGLGATGIRELPNEPAVLNAFQTYIQEPGLYLFPGTGLGPNATREQQQAAMQEMQKKADSGPSGILVIRPKGGGGLTPFRLIHEFILNVVQALLLAILLAWAGNLGGYASRVAFVAVAGFFGTCCTNIQYWNWYSFPTNYTIAYMFTDFVGFLFVGLIAAALIRRKTASTHA